MYHTIIAIEKWYLKQKCVLLLSFFMGGILEVEHTQAAPSPRIGDLQDGMPDLANIRAADYVRAQFGIRLPYSYLTAEYRDNVHTLQQDLVTLRDISFFDQQIVNISKPHAHAQHNGWDSARTSTQQQFDQVMQRISDLALVNDGVMRARFNGKVPMDGLTEKEKKLSGVLFVLNNTENTYAMTRMIIEYSQRTLMDLDIGATAWGEIAQKVDAICQRLSPAKGEQLMHQLPNWMRLIVYGQRSGVHREDQTYYKDIAEQAHHLETFDMLVRTLRRKSAESLSKPERDRIVYECMNLPFLHPQTGALRERSEFLRRFEHPDQRALIFMLTCIRNIGIQGATAIYEHIGEQLLVGRALMGALPGRISENILEVAGDEAVNNPANARALYESAMSVANRIG